MTVPTLTTNKILFSIWKTFATIWTPFFLKIFFYFICIDSIYVVLLLIVNGTTCHNKNWNPRCCIENVRVHLSRKRWTFLTRREMEQKCCCGWFFPNEALQAIYNVIGQCYYHFFLSTVRLQAYWPHPGFWWISTLVFFFCIFLYTIGYVT